jgi:molecular chaperone DnaK
MNKIGLDFGTTNCTLSYYDSSRNVIESYRMGSAGSQWYIPSFVSYENEDQSIQIGRPAKRNQDDDDFSVFSAFKMLLGEKNPDRLESFGYFDTKPDDCAKDYINCLIQNYCTEKNIDAIDEMVITVPEIWVKEHQHASRESLRIICADLNLPVQRFVSEPVAATAYFVYCFKAKTQKPFNGHVLVCDYGGGTLDLSLSKVEGEKISVLECTGKGHDNTFLGRAGLAFDEDVVTKVYEHMHGGKKLSRSNPVFKSLMIDFEEYKIDHNEKVTKSLHQYLKNHAINKKIFKVNSMPFYPSDFDNAFKKVISPEMTKALSEMKEYLNAHHVDINNSDEFRIVMVGGFSNFYLVKQSIMDFFESKTLSDKRFDSHFDLEDASLAISKGAALIANDMIELDVTCPISIGLKVKSDMNGFLEDVDIAILRKGGKISEYAEPIFIKGGIRFEVDPAMRKTPVILFIGDNERRKYIRLDQNIDQLFPNTHIPENLWKVGFSVNENFLFTLHTEDSKGMKKENPLGDILSMVSGLIYFDDKK